LLKKGWPGIPGQPFLLETGAMLRMFVQQSLPSLLFFLYYN
jgi:hypothetical protein